MLVSGSAVGTAQILIWFYSCVFLPPMSTAIRTSAFSFVGDLTVFLCIPETWSLPSLSCGFNLKLVQLVGRFGVFFLSHTAPGFQLWFYFHLCMWVVLWVFLLRLLWRTCFCPSEDLVNSSPHPGVAPQSLNSSSQLLHLLGDLCPCPGMYGCGKDCLFSFHLGCHRSAVSLSSLNVSPLTQTVALMWGLDPCFSSPTH